MPMFDDAQRTRIRILAIVLTVACIVFFIGFFVILFGRNYSYDGTNKDLYLVMGVLVMIIGGATAAIVMLIMLKLYLDERKLSDAVDGHTKLAPVPHSSAAAGVGAYVYANPYGGPQSPAGESPYGMHYGQGVNEGYHTQQYHQQQQQQQQQQVPVDIVMTDSGAEKSGSYRQQSYTSGGDVARGSSTAI